MSSLTLVEKRDFENLFRMPSGYVLNFTNRDFGELFADTVRMDIHSPKYTDQGTSKANKLRVFWRLEDDSTVGRVLREMIRLLETNPYETDTNPELLARCKATVGRLLSGLPDLENLKVVAFSLDLPYIHAQIRRMEESVNTDPALAIGTAKELVETVCKSVLREHGKPVDERAELPGLAKLALAELSFEPFPGTGGEKGGEVTRRLLANLSAITQGLAELRNLHGTGHGKDGKTPSVEPRHAALAVGAATAFSRFVFETSKAESTGKSPLGPKF